MKIKNKINPGLISLVAVLSLSGCDKVEPDKVEENAVVSEAKEVESFAPVAPLHAALESSNTVDMTSPPTQPIISPPQPPKFGGVNLALSKPATQSSNFSDTDATASKAVDGNTDGVMLHGSVAHTSVNPKSKKSWLDIDLAGEKIVNGIVVWNRTDCCGERLSNYWIFVSNKPFSPEETPDMIRKRKDVLVKVKGDMPNPFYALDTHQVKGRFMRIQLDESDNGEGVINLAEVQVFGE